jgi:hypothetical protein
MREPLQDFSMGGVTRPEFANSILEGDKKIRRSHFLNQMEKAAVTFELSSEFGDKQLSVLGEKSILLPVANL